MTVLLTALLAVFNLLCVGMTLLTLPGNWLMVAATLLVAWLRWDQRMFHPGTLAAIVVLAALGELLELVASAAGAKRAGGTRGGAWGATLGGIVGALAGTFVIPVPLLGSLLGAAGGAFLGAWMGEVAGGRTHGQSVRVGIGAGAGRLVATLLKTAIGAAIWLVVLVAGLAP